MAIFTPNSSQPPLNQELLSYIIGAVMLAVLIYGCVQFYDADFRDCASGYSGNCGKFHATAEYRGLQRVADGGADRLAYWGGRSDFPG